MQFKPLPVMTVLTAVSLAILAMLGNWQYERFQEKRFSSPSEIPAIVSISGRVSSPQDALIQHVYGIADGEPIWRRYVAFSISGTDETVLLAIDATGGPRPVQANVPIDMPFIGDVRLFERESRASNRNRPDQNSWYTFDVPGLLANLGLQAGNIRVAEPVDLTIRNAEDLSRTRTTQNPYGAPNPIDDLPPERHFGYAITWWGLAAALFVMYFVFHASRGRISLRGK
ncbi:MAG: SURF1 family cytochrome oxidase biogenesis protein [Pseudomonadota bacterium]